MYQNVVITRHGTASYAIDVAREFVDALVPTP